MPTRSWWKFLWCVAILAVVGLIGLLVRQPWLFPSLGPTVIVLLETPREPAARLTNTLVGHAVAVLVGAGCLAVCGLYGQPWAPVAGLSARYVVSGAVSVTVTMLVLTVANLPHPPAGATTLLVSLGILTRPAELLSVIGAVTVVALLALWATRGERSSPPSETHAATQSKQSRP